MILSTNNKKLLYKYALALALFTIFYNIVEGIISTYFGFEDETLTLFGFGVDSFIEVISGIGIVHMIIRIQKNPISNRDTFERTALRITGVSFYLLVIGLVFTSTFNIWMGNKPITTMWGIVISLVSILVMWLLVVGKRGVGKNLNSEAVLADANCTMVCIYMSIILLASSIIYEVTQISFIDSIGTLGLAYFAFKEGKECFEKAKNDSHCKC